MRPHLFPPLLALLLALLLLALAQTTFASEPIVPTGSATVPPALPERLLAGDFECKSTGYYDGEEPDDLWVNRPNRIPNHWFLTYTGSQPVVDSARIYFAESCDGSAHVERISGEDSVLMQARDIEWSPEPGKPFDASLYQQVEVVSGTAYSLSGWMLTLCGGSNTSPRNDCPAGYYMAKLLGIDPTGGTDPTAPSVEWVENRRNFVQADGVTRYGWQNLQLAATAQGPTLTVFARIHSPFRWHGNHGFLDALSLVQAPTATLTASLPVTHSATISLRWTGSLGPDIPLAGGTHRLRYDVQYWHDNNQRWIDLLEETEEESTGFTAPCPGSTYRFRVQPRAEQPTGTGLSPNQRYPGLWSESVELFVPAAGGEPGTAPPAALQLFLPVIGNQRSC
ncbi:MAG: fibronectin type III domain-containing protein [Caldilinea sp.]